MRSNRTRVRKRPTRGTAPASFEVILAAAAELLTRDGYARLTTNRVAERAGVNVSLVYRYFASKDAILGLLLDRAMTATLEAARAPLAEATRPAAHPCPLPAQATGAARVRGATSARE